MTSAAARRLAGTIALVALLPAMAHARDGRYLTWSAKAPVPVQQNPQTYAPPMAVPSTPAPPSPYGQVGDPYVHVLTWGAKAGSGQAAQSRPQPQSQPQYQPVASAAPVRRAPVQQMQPMQATAPADAQPQWQAAPKKPAPPFRPDTRDAVAPTPMASTLPDAMQTGPIAEPSQEVRHTPPAVAVESPQPPMTTPVASKAPVQAPAADTEAYQVPSTSPYAARIAAARAAQAKAQAQAGQTEKAAAIASAVPAKAAKGAKAKTPVTPAPAAPAAAPVTTDASNTDTDKPFVPGQHYTDASEAPRLYSLHRDYGLKPDPITIDANPGGALLDTSKLDAAEAKAAKAADADDSDDQDTSDTKSDKTSTASPPSDAPAPKTKASS